MLLEWLGLNPQLDLEQFRLHVLLNKIRDSDLDSILESLYHFTQSGDKTGQLYQRTNTFQDTHVGKADFLDIRKSKNCLKIRLNTTLMYSNLVYSGILD